MSRPDLDIIRSPQAERMKGMVTKGFYDRSRIGLWMFEAMGREYDDMARWAQELRLEAFAQTCTWSIGIWEWVYGFEQDDSLSLEFRRQRLFAHIIGAAPINPEAIQRSVAAFTGANVEIIENPGTYTFEVVINPTENPLSYIGARRYIRSIKPSHLSFAAVLETPVMIQVSIDTTYNLIGTGLTGQY